MKKKILLVVFSVIIVFVTVSCIGDKDKTISRDTFLLDTLVNITIYDNDNPEIIDGAIDFIRELENVLSVHIVGSDLYNIRQNAGIKKTNVTEHTMNIIKRSMEYYELSNKNYDITLGPLIELWNESKDLNIVPNNNDIFDLLKYVGMNRITADYKNNSIFVDNGMFLDFGACAKGYISDCIKQYLLDKGIRSALINLGGNIDIIGTKTNGKDFGVVLRTPEDDPKNKYLGILKISNISIVTSGDYERYYKINGVKYHHILDPKTGCPAKSDLKSVSIITKESLDADILSTAVFVLGFEKGKKLIEDLDNIDAIFVTKDNMVYATDGIKERFELMDNNYKLIEH